MHAYTDGMLIQLHSSYTENPRKHERKRLLNFSSTRVQCGGSNKCIPLRYDSGNHIQLIAHILCNIDALDVFSISQTQGCTLPVPYFTP